MALQIVIKLYFSMEKNISLHTNCLYHPEFFKLEIKGTKYNTSLKTA